MDITPAEEAVVGLLRGEAGVDFVMSITTTEKQWLVTLAGDGDILVGAGASFREAMLSAFDLEPAADKEPSPLREAFKVVGGTEHQAEAAAS